MLMKATQLNLELSPSKNSFLYYFVPHSGVNSQWSFLQQSMEELNKQDYFFQAFYVYGEKGVGKTYLINCLKEISNFDFAYFDFSKLNIISVEKIVASFVEQYEKIKSAGGLLVVEANILPKELTANPHLLSRLNVAQLIKLDFPQEQELSALVSSLLERNNLKLKEKDINYILEHSPSDPLSLSLISARIEQLVFKDNVSPKRSLIKEALFSS